MSDIIRVSRSFASLGDTFLDTFGTTVSAKIYVAPAFDNPPVTQAELNMARSEFATAKANQSSNGKEGTALKNEKRAGLLKPLRKLAAFVEEASDNNLVTLLSSGFEAVSTNRASAPLAKPLISRINQTFPGEALVSVGAIPNAKSYEVRVALVDADNVAGPYVTMSTVTRSRNIPAAGLVPGAVHLFQVRAIGGLNGYSAWSDAVMQRVI